MGTRRRAVTWRWMTLTLVLSTVLSTLLVQPRQAGGATWHVSPEGRVDGKGTREAPWDIGSALDGSQKSVRPGDTVELAAGTYRRRPKELFDVRLAGEAGRPVVVRGAKGRRVTIDGGLSVVEPSKHLHLRDLEIFVSEPLPEKPVSPGSHPTDLTKPPGGLHVHAGQQNRYINLVIHNCRQGVSWWVGDKDSELHGCVIYDNGWVGTDRGHGHAIYTQNNEGTKIISNCIMTGGHSYTVHAYGSKKAYVNNYLIEGNVVYAAGPFLVGGGRPSSGIRVINNYLHGSSMRIGYDAPYNEDCVVTGNVIVNGGLEIKNYKRAVNEENVVLKDGAPQKVGPWVLRPNRYDDDRAHLVVWNLEKNPKVEVLSGTAFLKPGDRYRLMNPRDLFGKPVLKGKYDGASLSVPMEGEFAAFVLLRDR